MVAFNQMWPFACLHDSFFCFLVLLAVLSFLSLFKKKVYNSRKEEVGTEVFLNYTSLQVAGIAQVEQNDFAY